LIDTLLLNMINKCMKSHLSWRSVRRKSMLAMLMLLVCSQPQHDETHADS
jgi:hypothetical protein